MNNNTSSIKIAVAESSVIIRSGLATVLKRLPNLNVHPIEISSPESLQNYIRLNAPNILIINPNFGGWFDIAAFKAENARAETKKRKKTMNRRLSAYAKKKSLPVL